MLIFLIIGMWQVKVILSLVVYLFNMLMGVSRGKGGACPFSGILITLLESEASMEFLFKYVKSIPNIQIISKFDNKNSLTFLPSLGNLSGCNRIPTNLDDNYITIQILRQNCIVNFDLFSISFRLNWTKFDLFLSLFN